MFPAAKINKEAKYNNNNKCSTLGTVKRPQTPRHPHELSESELKNRMIYLYTTIRLHKMAQTHNMTTYPQFGKI